MTTDSWLWPLVCSAVSPSVYYLWLLSRVLKDPGWRTDALPIPAAAPLVGTGDLPLPSEVGWIEETDGH